MVLSLPSAPVFPGFSSCSPARVGPHGVGRLPSWNSQPKSEWVAWGLVPCLWFCCSFHAVCSMTMKMPRHIPCQLLKKNGPGCFSSEKPPVEAAAPAWISTISWTLFAETHMVSWEGGSDLSNFILLLPLKETPYLVVTPHVSLFPGHGHH